MSKGEQRARHAPLSPRRHSLGKLTKERKGSNVTATPKPPINAAIATIGTDPAARKCASSKQPRNSERSVLQRCGEVVSKQACARLLNPGWGLSSSEGRLYSRRAVRSVLAEPLPAFLAASKSLALGHAGTHKEESVAAAPTV
jgi:hypothetical protein